MNLRRWERVIWGAIAAVLLLGARQTVRAYGRAPIDGHNARPVRQRAGTTPALVMFDGESLDSAATLVVAHDVFRLERKPATVAYSVTPTGFIAPSAQTTPTIRIALQGTIGGPPWHAIISGVPGHDGTIVVSAGDTLGGVAIRRVNRDSVTVRVKDSTWTVTLGRTGAQ